MLKKANLELIFHHNFQQNDYTLTLPPYYQGIDVGWCEMIGGGLAVLMASSAT